MNRNIPLRRFLFGRNFPGRTPPLRTPPIVRTVSIENAIVEEVFEGSRGDGYILVSRGVPGTNNMLYKELLRLNISRRTRIKNPRGRNVRLGDIESGMRINAIHSPVVTRSIPPQTEAYEITVLTAAQPHSITTDRLVRVEPRNNILVTGNPRVPEEQKRFLVTEDTVIRNQLGQRIRLIDLEPGQLLRIEHAEFTILIYPQQIAAYRIQVLPRI